MKTLRTKFNYYLTNYPLFTIMTLGLLFRLLAAFLSKGYGMHDDHFSVIEAAGSWADGEDYGSWLPASGNQVPQGHSLFYPGFNYLLFVALKWLGIGRPATMMLINRLLHAVFSMAIVYYGYKITEKISNTRYAVTTGFILALLWAMPFLSVRNLVEIVCIPFLMYGFWVLVRKTNLTWKDFLWAGFVFGLAYSVRFQTMLIIGGVGLALLFRNFWGAVFLGIGSLLSIVLVQGGIDQLVWGKPFVEMIAYIKYNMVSSGAYGNHDNWLMYVEVILGFLIPPFSVLLAFGFARKWKSQLVMVLPFLIFLLFHSWFENRQERFILTVIPLFVVVAVPGWYEFYEKSAFWMRHTRLHRGIVTFFWVVNLAGLLVVSTSSSKLSRVESMAQLYDKRDEISALLIEDTSRNGSQMLPEFYLGKWVPVFMLSGLQNEADSLRAHGDAFLKIIYTPKFFRHTTPDNQPDYILFVSKNDIENRVNKMTDLFPALTHYKTIEPANIDRFVSWLNPVNRNETIFIYATGVDAANNDD